ncbi:imidazole glycerol phosphate synthase subunit HisH [Dactylosporangium sp. NPDC049140]|uniref:imidazole glycerol phosphate synthase subunit HisH n=1 Tax=Dactylosporangium sp. NPDC049140 TaxID=3155647 RepID=UPI0033F7A8EE
MAKRVVILDYGSGNLRSAERAVARVGADVEVTDDLGKAARADGLVVPGVGAYAACMAGIEALGAGPTIAERVRTGAPVLGICVGMQVLFESGEEHGVVTKGLGLAPGSVTRLQAPVVPHMGWNTVAWPEGSVLGAGIPDDTRYYFVHSYASTVVDAQAEAGVRVATTVHGEPFVAAFETDVLRATQFHPEKSGDAGATLLANWLGTL